VTFEEATEATKELNKIDGSVIVN